MQVLHVPLFFDSVEDPLGSPSYGAGSGGGMDFAPRKVNWRFDRFHCFVNCVHCWLRWLTGNIIGHHWIIHQRILFKDRVRKIPLRELCYLGQNWGCAQNPSRKILQEYPSKESCEINPSRGSRVKNPFREPHERIPRKWSHKTGPSRISREIILQDHSQSRISRQKSLVRMKSRERIPRK